MPRRFFIWLVVALIPALLLGCDWYGRGEVARRPLPYPYDAGIALNDGSTHEPLSSRGVMFLDDGEDVHTVGQNAACSLVDRGRQLVESLVFLYARREWRGSSFFGNMLAELSVDASGGNVRCYKTYVGRPVAVSSSIPEDVIEQMTSALTYELKAKGGLMIIGESRDAGGSRPYPRLNSAVLRHLRAEHDAGRVRLFDLDELLSYDHVGRHLVWDVESGEAGVSIDIRAVDDGVSAPWIPTLKELRGVTFYTPSAERTVVTLSGESVPVVSNPADRTRRESVTVITEDPGLRTEDDAAGPPGDADRQ